MKASVSCNKIVLLTSTSSESSEIGQISTPLL